MFPRSLGQGVHVVFSARHAAGKDWLADLDLRLGEEARIELGRLSEADIAEILERAGQASDADLPARIAQKTLGDPFYVADVVRVLTKAVSKTGVLDELPPTHSDYLNAWWKEGIKRVVQPGFVDLMGTLAALRAPLGARELTAIYADDQLDGAHIGVLLEEAARFVEDDRQGRYWLRHDRIRQFVRETLGDDMRKYDERVNCFALKWNDETATEEARAYGRRHVVAHLLGQDRYTQALDVLGADFIAARWREDGSYSTMLNDLDAMLAWSGQHVGDRNTICHALSLAVMRESARDLMRGLPAPLCRAWVRLAGPARPLEMLASLPSHRGEARVQLLAVASEMLDLAAAGEAGRPDRAAACELLARTVGLLPLVRTDRWVVDTLSEVCNLLVTHSLDQGQAEALLRQGIAYCSQLDHEHRDLKALCLAHLATAALPVDRNLASHLVTEIDAMIGQLMPAERAFALAAAFPAYRQFAADRIADLAKAAAHESQANPSGSGLAPAPLEFLLSQWAPDAQATQIALQTSESSLSLLCKLGLTDVAWQRVNEAVQTGNASAGLLLEAYDSMAEHGPRLLDALRALSAQGPPTPDLARALALARRWGDVRAVLENLTDQEVGKALPPCLAVALEQGDVDGEGSVTMIIGQIERVPTNDAPEVAGSIAHALAKAGHRHARQVLGLAFRLALSRLPEGDADDTRCLVALAMTSEAKLDQALAVAVGCKSWERRIMALRAVLHTLHTDSADRIRVAQLICDLLKGPRDGAQVANAVRAACAAALELGTLHRAEALRLVESAESACKATRVFRGDFDSRLVLHFAKTKLGSEQAGEEGRALLTDIQAEIHGPGPSLLLDALFSLCASLIESGFAEKGLLEHEVDLLRHRPLEKQIHIEMLAAAAAAVARFEPVRAAEWLREGMGDLENLKGPQVADSVSLASFKRLVSDLMGDSISEPRWVKAISGLIGALVSQAASFTAEAISGLLLHAWARTLELAEDPDTLRTAAANYFKRLGALPLERVEMLKTVVGHVLEELERHRGALDVDGLLEEAASEFSSHGHVEAARKAAQGVAEPEHRQAALSQVEPFSYFFSLVDRTPAEQALYDIMGHKSLAAATVQNLRGGITDQLLVVLLAGAEDARVRRLIFNLAPAFAAIMMHRWGVEAGEEVVDSVEEFDGRLTAAASQVVLPSVAQSAKSRRAPFQ